VMEDLVWNKNIIKKLSSHCRTEASLPDEVVNKMSKIRDLNIGIHYRKNILLSIYDQLVHSSTNLIDFWEKILTDQNITEENKKSRLAESLTNLYQELHQKIMPSISLNKGFSFPIEWITSLVNNDATVYSSIWSKIYSTEILSKKVVGGIIDPQLGHDMYHKLMKHGGSRSSIEYLHDLIGSIPSIEGFFDYYNLESDVEHSYFFSSDRFKTENIKSETEIGKNALMIEQFTEEDDDEEEQSNYFTEDGVTDTDNVQDSINLNYVENIKSHKKASGGMIYIKDKLNQHHDDNLNRSCSATRYNNIFIKR
jgi:hypothetical protein